MLRFSITAKAACSLAAQHKYQDQRNYHYDCLHEVRCALRQGIRLEGIQEHKTAPSIIMLIYEAPNRAENSRLTRQLEAYTAKRPV